MVLAKPIRSLRIALRYWLPKRLTLKSNPAIYAWLWWNFRPPGDKDERVEKWD